MKVLISFKYELFGVFSKKTYKGELYVNDLDKENHFLYNPVCICITLEELCCIVQYMQITCEKLLRIIEFQKMKDHVYPVPVEN